MSKPKRKYPQQLRIAAALLDLMQQRNKTSYTYEGADGRLRRVSLRQLAHKVVISDVKAYSEIAEEQKAGAAN